MEIQEQIKSIDNNFEVSNHTFINQLMSGLQARITETVPDLKLRPTGKKASKGQITLTMVGQVTIDPIAGDIDSVDDKIRQLMDSLKNPTNLIEMIR